MSFDFNRTAMRLTSTRRQSVNKDKKTMKNKWQEDLLRAPLDVHAQVGSDR